MAGVIDTDLNAVLIPSNEAAVRVTAKELETACMQVVAQMDHEGIERGVMVVLTPTLLDDTDAVQTMRRATGDGRLCFSCAVDFRGDQSVAQLEAAAGAGVRFLKFHPYLQRIEERDFARCCALSARAEMLGMGVMVCCSHGTRALARHSGLYLAAAISEVVTCPIIMSHAGGRQVLDAMLVAEHAPNVYLETSFSLPYYLGSSVEMDFAFAMRKLGSRRWLYGSDYPFHGMRESLDTTVEFLQRHGFSSGQIDDVLHGTAEELHLL